MKKLMVVLVVVLGGCRSYNKLMDTPFDHNQEKKQEVVLLKCCAPDIMPGTALLCEEIKSSPDNQLIDLKGVIYKSDC